MEERREERRADTGHRLNSNIQHRPQSTGGGEDEDGSGGLISGNRQSGGLVSGNRLAGGLVSGHKHKKTLRNSLRIFFRPQSTGGGEEEEDSGGLVSGQNIKQKQNYTLRNNQDLLNNLLLIMTLGWLNISLRGHFMSLD